MVFAAHQLKNDKNMQIGVDGSNVNIDVRIPSAIDSSQNMSQSMGHRGTLNRKYIGNMVLNS